MRSTFFSKAFLSLGSLAAGAGLGSAVIEVVGGTGSTLISVIAALVGLAVTILSGAFREKQLFSSEAQSSQTTSY